MPRQTLIKKNYLFVGGLNTDSGYLQQVPNSWKEGDNIVPFLDGHIERRTKIDLEDFYDVCEPFSEQDASTMAFSVDLWTSVGGNGLLNFAVAQRGTLVFFYDCNGPSVSPNKKTFYIDLFNYRCPTSPLDVGTSPIAISCGNGKLVITSAYSDPVLVSYDADTDDITVTRLTLKIRDFYGVVDTTPLTTNSTTLTDTHHYNLFNQGWNEAQITSYFTTTGTYPDDTQIWLQGKDTSDDFSPTLLDKQDFGTSAAPKGRYVLDIFNRDRTTVSGVTGLSAEVEDYRPVTTAFFAGRAWYAGTQSSSIGSWVLFSRICDTNLKYEQCYQEGDPTSEYSSDLISSDGGVIPILGAGGILLLKPLQDSLLVFAQNGIWQISGDAYSGFKADGYQVKQIASFGILSAKSVVDVETTVMFWSTAGIYTLELDNTTGSYTPKSISLGKIQTLYEQFQEQSHMSYVQGFYDNVTKTVYWLHHIHRAEEPFTNEYRFEVENLLLYNVTLSAFYTMTLPEWDDYAMVVGGFLSPNTGNTVLVTDVVLSNEDTVVVGLSSVIASVDIKSTGPRIPKFLTLLADGADRTLTFSDFVNTADAPNKFKDWYTVNSSGFEVTPLPYVMTGYDIEEDGAKNHQAPYIITHLIKTEDGYDSAGNVKNESSCTLHGRWEWTDNASASRWTTGEEVYRHRQMYTPADTTDTYADGYPLIVAKSKLRGKGKALQLKYSSASGKDMKIAGWAIQYMVDTNV